MMQVSLPMVLVVGVPIRIKGTLQNCAAVISSGRIHAVVGKTYFPNYDEFYENRWFTPAESNSTIFEVISTPNLTPSTSKMVEFDSAGVNQRFS